MNTPDKVIVTNLAQFKSKYKSAGLTKVKSAVNALIKADKTRGLTTVLVDISNTATIKKLNGKPGKDGDFQSDNWNKQAIDAVYASLRPAYVMILGSIDVIPQQNLDNPLYDPGNDDDKFVPSDLPYACDGSYSTKIKDFLAPTRVIGRLPNVTGDTDPAYLIGLLKYAASHVPRTRDYYDTYLAITADVWKKSTAQSVAEIFGSSSELLISPPKGPAWTTKQLQSPVHFINCHGAPADWRFYGQKGTKYPEAHDATKISTLTPGTILAAECCFGAELYNPDVVAPALSLGMCNTYLGLEAAAYFGSSTIAYGPSEGNDLADLLCQNFVINVLGCSSAGRACLQARIDYVNRAQTLSPTDQKTLAQFSLMGDPSLTPVSSPADEPKVMAKSKKSGMKTKALDEVKSVERFQRRETMREASLAAAKTVSYASAVIKKIPKLDDQILQVAMALGIDPKKAVLLSYKMANPIPKAQSKAFPKNFLMTHPSQIHVLMERRLHKQKQVFIKGIETIQYDGTSKLRGFVSR